MCGYAFWPGNVIWDYHTEMICFWRENVFPCCTTEQVLQSDHKQIFSSEVEKLLFGLRRYTGHHASRKLGFSAEVSKQEASHSQSSVK